MKGCTLYKKIFFQFILIGSSFFCYSQNKIQRDTSYTVASTYNKLIKKYPDINIVSKQIENSITEETEVIYKKIGNRILRLDAYYSSFPDKHPAVLLIHGGGWKSGDKSMMSPMAAKLAANGYSCFTIEYRLSPEAKYPSAIYDVKSAIQFVKSNAAKFNVDTTRVAVLGCSSGGQMAALVGTTNKNKEFEDKIDFKSKVSTTIQAIVNIDGILAFKHPESNEGEMAALWLGGTYDEKSYVWNDASALNHVDEKAPPILFINSSFDRFHAGRDDMISILNRNNIYSEVKTIVGSPHSFWLFDPWFEQTVEYTTQFLQTIFKKI